MRGNSGLAEAKDFLKFCDGKFFLLEEEQEPETSIIGEEPERFED
jgi:hypothetical protein